MAPGWTGRRIAAAGRNGNIDFWKSTMTISKTGSNGRQPLTRYRNAILLGCTALVALTPTLAMAQQAESGASTTLETVTVDGGADGSAGPNGSIVAKNATTGTKTGTPIKDTSASVSVITSEEITARGAENLDQVLAYTSGVSSDIYGSDDRSDFFLIRGFYQSSYGKYWDGLPLRTWNFTGSRMEPYGMERFEVLKGSTSSLFGLNGPGGLVNAITKRPRDEAFGELYTTLGGDHVETGTDFGGPIGTDSDWSYRLTGKWQNADNGPDYTQDDRFYIAPALTWSPDDMTSFTLLTSYNKRDGNTAHGIPRGFGLDSESYFGEEDFDSFDTVERAIGYVFDHDFGNGLSFSQTMRYSTLDVTYEGLFNTTTAPGGDPLQTPRGALAVYGEAERLAIDNRFLYEASLSDAIDTKTLLGLDYAHDKVKETRLDGLAPSVAAYTNRGAIAFGPPGVTDTDISILGLYAQEEVTLSDRWILTAGGRYNWVSQDDGTEVKDKAFTGRLGVTYKATNEFSVYANYSESFQPLGTYRPTAGETIKPQEGTQYEAGVKYAPEGMDALFTFAYFDLTQTNVTQYDAAYLVHQIGEVNVRGIELEGKMAVTDRMNLTLAYSYWNAEIADDLTAANIGNRPENVPNQMASAWIDYTIPGDGAFGDFTIGAGVRFVGSTYADNANSIKVNPFTVFDAALTYKVTESTVLQVTATNIFDKEYVTHVDEFSDTAYYGDRRTVKATLRYTW